MTVGRNIRVKQGLRAELPVLRVGELGFATDDFSFWIGSDEGNKMINDGSGAGGSIEIDDGTIGIEKLSQELQDKINSFMVINNLTSTSEINPVSANQARLLKEDLDNHKTKDATLTEKGHVYHGVVNAVITATWNGTQAPYTQEVTVNGIKAGDSPFVTVDYSSNVATVIQEREAYLLIDSAITDENKIIFTCFEEHPIRPLSIQVKVVR